ncbi:MAG: DNA polymerase, partial [candidate division Zixibacteria bacterium]|nr:DNA polymerase [candidate division Zixibacteria bacterium]
PLLAATSCCIATSREAKKLGVRTGPGVAEAKRICPGIQIVVSEPEKYVNYHFAIVETVESFIPVAATHSIDEMSCRLTGPQREVAEATRLAHAIKAALREKVGAVLTCSIGLAPTRLLAKTACDMQKPDGLTVIRGCDLPEALYTLVPEDIPGIGSRMKRRLEARGITTMPQLWALTEDEMKRIWGGVTGRRMWHWLHGHDIPDVPTHESSLGHSHVLSPDLRTQAGAYAVLQKLLHRAAGRLRRQRMWATGMMVLVKSFNDQNWEAKTTFIECQDTLTLLQTLRGLWAQHPATTNRPLMVGVTLLGLVPDELHNLSLFDEPKRRALSHAIDRLNARFGRETVYFGGIHAIKAAAPTRIPFQTIPDFGG